MKKLYIYMFFDIFIIFFLLFFIPTVYADNYIYDLKTNRWINIDDQDGSKYYNDRNEFRIIDDTFIEKIIKDKNCKIRIQVIPVTKNIEIIESDKQKLFRVESDHKTIWKFVFKIENISNLTNIDKIEITDVFKNGFNIINKSHSYSNKNQNGILDIIKDSTENIQFSWHDFSLKPGDWGKLSFEVEKHFDLDEDNKFNTGRIYDLNSGCILKYIRQNEMSYTKKEIENFVYNISRPPYISFNLSTQSISWYLRKPGIYFSQVLDGKISSNYPVIITFTNFDVLKSDNTAHTIPINYQLNTSKPINWLELNNFNNSNIYVPSSEEPIKWNLWQKIILKKQSAGDYQDKGVITFTINNQ